ncbi:MAG: hypothetical protein ABIJ09_05430 [Pseudomonadota bacterium]
MRTKTIGSRTPWIATVLALGVLAAWPAGAQSPGIPYHGYLELDGQAVSGAHTLVFTLYDVPTAGTALGTPLSRQVQVFAGSFATILTPLPVEAFDGRALYLQIAIDGHDLAGRQRLLSVPFAMGTSQGDNFVVSGRLGIANTSPGHALVIGSGANTNPPQPQTDLRVPESTIAIPLGDEAAGGLYLYDGQGATQHAEITYSSGDEKIRLHNKGLGLRVDNAGNVEIDGNLSVTGNLQVAGAIASPSQGLGSCPADMSRIGPWCIDDQAKSNTWSGSVNDCDARNAMICPLNVILMCDEQNLGKGTGNGYTCGNLTDGDGEHPVLVRTGDTHAPVDTNGYGESAYDRISCFNYSNNDIDTSTCQPSNVRYYFCCRPALF